MTTNLKIQDNPLNSLINEGRYARLNKFLSDLQTTVEPTDQSTLKNLTTTAIQICLFCQQCQTEIDWHKQAGQEARLRLNELNAQLDALLNSIIEYDPRTESQCPAMSVSLTLLEDRVSQKVSDNPNLWQRIRNLFNLKSIHSESKQLIAKVVVNTSLPSTDEKSERLSNLENPATKLWSDSNTRSDNSVPNSPLQLKVNNVMSNVEIAEQDNKPATSTPNLDFKDDSAVLIGEKGQYQDIPPSFMIYCLGSFRVYQNDQLVQEWSSSKGKSIFKYLIAQQKQSVPKEVLMELFWPGAQPDAARNNLNVSIYGLRQTFRGINADYSHILFQEESYLLNPEMNIWIDAEEFTKRIQIGFQKEKRGDINAAILEYQAAEALYQGEFLAEDRYEDWLINQRLSLQDDYLKLLDRLSEHYIERKDFAACVAVCNKMLAVDPCREEAHRQLMRCYSCQGQPYLALRQFHMCEEALKAELDLPPSPETAELYRRIRAGKHLSVASA